MSGAEKPFALPAGMDKRLTPAREDIAAAHLRDKVSSRSFVEGARLRTAVGATGIRRAPGAQSPLDTELLFGETFTVYERREGWVWGQSGRDDYVGYVSAQDLRPGVEPPTHSVGVLRTYLFPEPDLKRPPTDILSLNAKLRVAEEVAGNGGPYARLETGGYVVARHLRKAGEAAADFAGAAEMFLGAPYLWGGKTSIGLDCSGLVQMAAEACGITCPRDADMQEAALGEALNNPEDLSQVRRGDLIFWKGHVGIAVDPARMIHANATAMATSIDTIADFAARIAGSEGPVTSLKRLTL